MALARRSMEEIRAPRLSEVLETSAVVRPQQMDMVRSSTVPVINIYNESRVSTENVNKVVESSPGVLDELKIPMTDRFYLMGMWGGCLNWRVSKETVEKLRAKRIAETVAKLETIVIPKLERERKDISDRLDGIELQSNQLKLSIQQNRLGPVQVSGVLTRKAEELVSQKLVLEQNMKMKKDELKIARALLTKYQKTKSAVHEVMLEYSKSMKGFDVNGVLSQTDEEVDRYMTEVEQNTDMVDRLELISADPRQKKAFKAEVDAILGLSAVSTNINPPVPMAVAPKPILTVLSDETGSDDGGDPPEGDLDTGMLLESSRDAKKNVKQEAKQLNAVMATL